MRLGLALATFLMVLLPVYGASADAVRQAAPGTVVREWVVRWPERGEKRALFKRFPARPGLIKRVRVVIASQRVAGPPNVSIVGCRGERHVAAAQRSWLWDGRNVYVALLLDPGRCDVAGTRTTARVVLTSVGT
jgi:hypothetical protein